MCTFIQIIQEDLKELYEALKAEASDKNSLQVILFVCVKPFLLIMQSDLHDRLHALQAGSYIHCCYLATCAVLYVTLYNRLAIE